VIYLIPAEIAAGRVLREIATGKALGAGFF